MTDYKVIRLKDNPERKDIFAIWFHEKWSIPLEAYLESMNKCLKHQSEVPQWYGVIVGNKMIAGLGLIENDFHNRKDLSPNVCAVYVEEEYRCQGIAGKMLDFVSDDMKSRGIGELYLITDHTSFYERYGWKFLCMVQGEGEPDMTRMYIHQSDKGKEGMKMKTKLTHIKLSVSNIENSLKWYTKVLGFEVDSCYPAENPIYYDFKQADGACFSIGLAENVVPNGRYNFQSENIDELWEQLNDKVTIIEPLYDTPWGTRKFTIADPDGNELGFN